MTKKSGESAKAMKQLGVSAFDAEGNMRNIEDVIVDMAKALSKLEEKDRIQLINMIGGKTQAKTVQKLLQGMTDETGNLSKEYIELKANIEKAPDMSALETMAKTMTDNLGGDFKLLLSSISEGFLTIFDEVGPQLREFVQGLTEKIIELTEKFRNLSPDMQMFIVKVAGAVAILPPLLILIGTLGSGVATVSKAFIKVTDLFSLFSSTAAIVGSKTSFLSSTFSFLGVAVSGVTLAIGAIVAVLGLVAYAVGENEDALAWLQDRWGVFGEFVGAVCESLAGWIQLTLGNAVHLIKGIGRSLAAIVTGNFREIDDIWRETWANMENTTAKASSNIAGESSQALSLIRKSTSKEMKEINKIFDQTMETLPTVTKDNLEDVSKTMTGYFESMSNDSLTILRGTSDTMAIMLEGISEGMKTEKIEKRLKENIKGLLNAGKVSASELEKDFSKATNLISKNLSDSVTRSGREGQKVIKELNRVAVLGVDGVSSSVTSLIKSMDQETFNTLKNVGGEWGNIFKDIENTANLSSEQVTEIILANLNKLGATTPEGMAKLVEKLKTSLDEVGGSVKSNVAKTTEGVNAQILVGASAAQEVILNLKSVTDKTSNEIYTKIVGSIERMGVDTANKLSSSSDAWKNILKGAFDESGKFSNNFKETVKKNLDKLNIKTPEQMAQFALKLEEGMRNANINASAEAELAKINISSKTLDIARASEDVGFKITENVTPKGLQEKVTGAMQGAEAGLNSQKASFTEEARSAGSEAEQKFRAELENMSSIDIPNSILNVEKIKNEMSLGGQLAVQSFINSWNDHSGIISNGIGSTFSNIAMEAQKPFAGIESVLNSLVQSLRNVRDNANSARESMSNMQNVNFSTPKNGADFLRKSLNLAKNDSANLRSELNKVASVSTAKITSGIQQMNVNLVNVTSKAKTCRASLLELSKVAFNNNHRALDTTATKLDKVKRASDNVKRGFDTFLRVSFSGIHGSLDRIASKLDTARTRAFSAKSAISNINSVGFGSLISRLSSVNSWLNTVRNSANSARSSVASVNSGGGRRSFSLFGGSTTFTMPENTISETVNGFAERFSEVDIANYQTSGGFYKPQPMSGSGVVLKDDSKNDRLLKALLQQNNLLMQLLGRDTDINVNLAVDGRTVAKATARHMNEEIENFNKRKNRLGGRF